MNRRGLLIALEGIDGSGTTTQINILHDYFKSLSKYNDVLTTHEPWKSDEIKKMSKEEKDPYTNGLKMTELFIQDRKNHLENLIEPAMKAGAIVICDRYHLSTYAYQGIQGISRDEIKRLHEQNKIINPNLTLFLDVDYKTAKKRIAKRGEPLEKFEGNKEFIEKLIQKYNELTTLANENQILIGPIARLNGNQSIKNVAKDIIMECDALYDIWLDHPLFYT